MGYTRKSGHSAAGKVGNHKRSGSDAAADDDAPEDSVAVTAISSRLRRCRRAERCRRWRTPRREQHVILDALYPSTASPPRKRVSDDCEARDIYTPPPRMRNSDTLCGHLVVSSGYSENILKE